MALDGLVCRSLVDEFKKKLTGTRIDKIYQPQRDELLIYLRGKSENFRLKLSANASIPRVSFSYDEKNEVLTPPVFCMLLRKHLISGKIIDIFQPEAERVINFVIEGYNEIGDVTTKTLIIEIMGRHSNIILIDENNKVLDSIKRVDFSVSSLRQILPGITYELPPKQNKKNPFVCSSEDFLDALNEENGEQEVYKTILNAFSGVSPLIAREIVYRATKRVDVRYNELSMSNKLDIALSAYKIFSDVEKGIFEPCYLTDNNSGKFIDFSAISIYQYENIASRTTNPSMANLINDYYLERSIKERNARRNSELLKLVQNNIERCTKKIEIQTVELADTEKKEKWREIGELITANIYKIKKGDRSILLENYYEDGSPQIDVKLDEMLNPSQNAQKYFKKYTKAKNAEIYLKEELKKAKDELYYLESVEEEIEKAQSYEELSDIADELFEQGYIKRNGQEKKKKKKMSMPKEFRSSDGFLILVGRNNKQNDFLTQKLANNNDLWFHTKNIHGSHVVLKYENERGFSDASILEAAQLAAFYSKAKNSENVPVDYTKIKFVKKPSGAKPGFVIYTSNSTAYVTPKEIKQ